MFPDESFGKILPIDRFIVQEYFSDTIHLFSENVDDCSRQIINIPLQSKFQNIIIEVKNFFIFIFYFYFFYFILKFILFFNFFYFILKFIVFYFFFILFFLFYFFYFIFLFFFYFFYFILKFILI